MAWALATATGSLQRPRRLLRATFPSIPTLTCRLPLLFSEKGASALGVAADSRATAAPLIYPSQGGGLVALHSWGNALGEKSRDLPGSGLAVGWETRWSC
jgi:hypothetical protein